MRVVVVILLVLMSFQSLAQDKVQYERGFEFNDGLYLTYQDFKDNNPIPRSNIQSKYDNYSLDFLHDLTDRNSQITYTVERDSTLDELTVSTDALWGYASNGKVYVNIHDGFYRVTILGSICHFVATVTFQTYVTDPYGMSQPVTRTEARQYIIDYNTGRVYDYGIDNLEMLLKRDIELYEEFSSLKKRKKKQSMFIYLTKYNERYPIYFP